MVALCKPSIPKVKDIIAHIFWKAEHFSTVHHHFGNHHAEEETAASEHEHDSEPTPSTSKISEPVSIHLSVQIFYTPSYIFLQKQKFGKNICMIPVLSLDKYYPPPKYS